MNGPGFNDGEAATLDAKGRSGDSLRQIHHPGQRRPASARPQGVRKGEPKEPEDPWMSLLDCFLSRVCCLFDLSADEMKEQKANRSQVGRSRGQLANQCVATIARDAQMVRRPPSTPVATTSQGASAWAFSTNVSASLAMPRDA